MDSTIDWGRLVLSILLWLFAGFCVGVAGVVATGQIPFVLLGMILGICRATAVQISSPLTGS